MYLFPFFFVYFCVFQSIKIVYITTIKITLYNLLALLFKIYYNTHETCLLKIKILNNSKLLNKTSN